MTYLLLALALVNTAAIVYALVWHRRWAIDPDRIGGAIAARLLDLYAGEVETLSEDGVNKHARERYLELCGAFGLPETAVVRVTTVAWRQVAAAQGITTSSKAGLYE